MTFHKPKPGRSLADLHPDVAAQWHPTANDRGPDEVSYGSKYRATWQCEVEGHDDWEASVNDRAKGSGCPACGRRRAGRKRRSAKDGKSLADLYPKVADQWHPTANGDLVPEEVTYGTNYKATWLCPKPEHGPWDATVKSRTLNSAGCPECDLEARWGTRRKHRPGRSLTTTHPDVAAQWHPTANDLTPEDVSYGSNYRATWQCEVEGHDDWDAVVNNRSGGTRCPACAIKRQHMPKPGRSLADLHPDIAAQWHPTANDRGPDEVSYGSKYRATWRCDVIDHDDWQATVAKRTGGGGCPKCAHEMEAMRKRIPDPGESLSDIHPDIAAQWHPSANDYGPEDVSYGSGYRATWQCDNPEHDDWEAVIRSRTKGSGCPACSRKRADRKRRSAKPGKSLADLYPEVADQWHPTANGDLGPEDVTYGTNYKVTWLCPKPEHGSWDASVRSRTINSAGCPTCGRESSSARGPHKPKPGKSLADLHPDVASQWHATANDRGPEEVTYGSTYRAWWRCDVEGHDDWETTVAKRSEGRGCPQCGREKNVATMQEANASRQD